MNCPDSAHPQQIDILPTPPPEFRILVVDDDPQVCALMEIFLTRVGMQVDTAPDGEAGWERLQQSQYDLVVLELETPRLSGLELAQRIRGHSLTVPLIVVSGDLHQFDRRHLESLQILEALEKGFNLQQLARRIETLLRTKRTQPL